MNWIKLKLANLIGRSSKFIKKHNLKTLTHLILLLLFFTVFVLKAHVYIDPDFGWRLITGRYILANGIPETDLYTFTMPSFPWVDHAWPVSVSFALLHDNFGMWSLTFIYSAIALASVIIVGVREVGVFAKKEMSFWVNLKSLAFMGNFVIILAFANILTFVGIRAQNVTWLMFSLLCIVLLNQNLWKKVRSLIPILLWLWGNLHGGFFAGLTALAIFIVFKSIRERKIDKMNVYVFLLSCLMTLINPYGTGTWREVWSSVSDTHLRFRIAEWMPIVLSFFDLAIVGYNTLAFILIYKYRKTYNLESLALYLFFLIQGILSARNIPLLVIISIPLTSRAVVQFYNEIRNNKIMRSRFNKVYLAAWIGSVTIFIVQSVTTVWGAYGLSEESFYPKTAVDYINQNYSNGERIFTDYVWGGYIIWKASDHKLFIDGRMPSWRWEGNPSNESNNAMQDYMDILSGEVNYAEEFKKYNVQLVLFVTPKEDNLFSYLDKKLKNLIERFGKENKDFDFVETLENDGWEKVYEDDKAVIYQVPENFLK